MCFIASMFALNYSSSRFKRMYAIRDHTKSASIAWNETLQINNETFAFKIDTGSDVNVISQDAFKKLKLRSKLTPTKTKLSSFSGHEINIIGSSNIKCSKNGKNFLLKFFISNVNTESVLGLQACIDLGIVAKIPPAPVEVIHQSTEKIIKIYSDVFDQPHVLRCNPFHINLQPCVKPIQAVCCKKTESRLKLKLETELKRMCSEGFLEAAEEKSAWSHPMIASMRSNDDISIYMDCRNLNRYLTADYYPLPFIEDDFSNIKGSQNFSLLTSPQAYMQIPLDEESTSICIIVTPCGRFKFKTIPYGFKRATDISHTVSSQIFHAIDGVFVYVDDILVYGKSKDEHNRRLIEVLDRARQYNLKFSKARLQLDKSEVRFMGYILSKDGARFDRSNVEAIRAMSAPINKQELQRFLSMIDSLESSVANLSHHSDPLKKLLEKTEKFLWRKEHEQHFSTLKNTLCEFTCCKQYSPLKDTYISVAASSFAIGTAALQDSQPLGFYSTSFSLQQQKYTQIEKKLLAVLCALERFNYLTYGKEVIVQSDHRPLLAIIKEPFDVMTPKLQSIMLKLMKYAFKIEYFAGKELAVACALSRSPLKKSSTCCVEETKVIPAHTLLCATEERINEFKRSLKEDEVLQGVVAYVRDGWPKYPSWIKSDARKFYNIKEELRSTGDLLFYDTKLVVPLKEKLEVLKQLHATHQGLKACQQKAKLLYFWPTMLKDIETYIAGCVVCQGSMKPDQLNISKHTSASPELPWIKIGIFFVQAERRDFAVLLDYFSKFLTIKPINVKTVKSVSTIVEEVCATHGLPLEIVAINAPPFNMPEWKQFLKSYDINFSHPDDDLLEKHAQISKTLIENSINAGSALFLAVMEHNATPKDGLPSPSELLMGRRLRTGLLVPKSLLMPNFDISKALATMKKGLEKDKCGCVVKSKHV